MASPALLLHLYRRRRRRHRRAAVGHPERADRDRWRSAVADRSRRAHRHQPRLESGGAGHDRQTSCRSRRVRPQRNDRDGDDGAAGGPVASGGEDGRAARGATVLPVVRRGGTPERPDVFTRAAGESRNDRTAGAADVAGRGRGRPDRHRDVDVHDSGRHRTRARARRRRFQPRSARDYRPCGARFDGPAQLRQPRAAGHFRQSARGSARRSGADPACGLQGRVHQHALLPVE